MALQGTIDTFPLTDVLALLESSAKTGLLTLSGPRGSGKVWLDGARIHGGTLDGDDSLVTDRLLFEMLRFEEGSFEFSSVEVAEFPDFGSTPVPVKACLESATQMLEQWERIEAIVPSVLHRICLSPELPVAELTVDAELWSFLVAVADADTVVDAAELLEMDNYECSAVVASLVEQQLVVISEPVGPTTVTGSKSRGVEPQASKLVEADPETDDATLIEELQMEEAMWEEPTSNFPERFPIDDLLLDSSDDADDPWGAAASHLDAHRSEMPGGTPETSFVGLPEPESAPVENGVGGSNHSGLREWDEMVNMEPAGSDAGSTQNETADEVLRQMSKLSPKAAEAIAAALGSTTDESQNQTASDESNGLGPVSFLDSF